MCRRVGGEHRPSSGRPIPASVIGPCPQRATRFIADRLRPHRRRRNGGRAEARHGRRRRRGYRCTRRLGNICRRLERPGLLVRIGRRPGLGRRPGRLRCDARLRCAGQRFSRCPGGQRGIRGLRRRRWFRRHGRVATEMAGRRRRRDARFGAGRHFRPRHAREHARRAVLCLDGRCRASGLWKRRGDRRLGRAVRRSHRLRRGGSGRWRSGWRWRPMGRVRRTGGVPWRILRIRLRTDGRSAGLWRP